MSFIYKETYKVRVQEIDHKKQIQAPELIKIMQDASMQHTIVLKASVWDLEAEQVSWVLIKKDIQFFRFPGWGELLTVETYPSGLESFFTFRDYRVFDENKVMIASAASTWTLMNTVSRKIVRIPDRFKALLMDIKDPLPRPFDKLHPSDDETINKSNFNIGYFHLDWNGHTNNVHIARFMIESVPDYILFNHTLQSFKIQFKSEALLHDELTSVVSSSDNLNFKHKLIRTNDNKEIALAFSQWK